MHRSGAAVVLFLLALCGRAAEVTSRSVDGPPVPPLPPVSAAVVRLPVLAPRPPGWRPTAPQGFEVGLFADGLDGPRRLLVLPGGDVLVAQARTERMAGMSPEIAAALTRQGIFGPSADNLILLRQTTQGVRRYVYRNGLNQPFGLLLSGAWLYVANTDALLRFRYQPDATRLEASPETVLALPAGERNSHWTRNIVEHPDGVRLFLAVGAASNVNEDGADPPERAAVWLVDPGSGEWRPYATGLRNPAGLALDPSTGALWATVNERDGLGEDVPPDYLARVVDGAFYGWPYVYFGTYPDPAWKRRDPGRVAAAARIARVPDLALGGHSVPLGLHFRRGDDWPAKYREGVFIARRGGVGRARFIGYDVIFVPFSNGVPTGVVEPFLEGFVADYDRGEVYGRPVDVAELPDGSLLVSDDGGNALWRVSWTGRGTVNPGVTDRRNNAGVP
jgi:glucose/arabinose dehydrogenase